MNYFEELTKAMDLLAAVPQSIFLGQGVEYRCHPMTDNLVNVPMEKRLEFPVSEDLQMGVSNGLALAGMLPVNIYPRFDFLLLACNQLFNHQDNMDIKVITRVCVGGKKPLNAGPQHTQDYSRAFKLMAKGNVYLIELKQAEEIMPAYESALRSKASTILVEYGDLYNREKK